MSPDTDPAAPPTPQRRQGDQTPARHHRPCRVEGARSEPERPGVSGAVRRPPGGKVIWLVLLGMFAVNWIVAAQIAPAGHPRVTVPYSYFRAQAQAGNVAVVSSQ